MNLQVCGSYRSCHNSSI